MSQQLPQSTLQWLYSVLAPAYAHPDMVYQDTVLVLQAFADLRPRTDVYTAPDGRQELLLQLLSQPTPSDRCLVRSHDYQLVVCVPQKYPAERPVVFLRPHKGFRVAPCATLDSDGRLETPVLKSWPYGQDTDNAGVDPINNRLLVLMCEIKMELEANPQLVVALPPIPAKPTLGAAAADVRNGARTVANSAVLNQLQLELNMALYDHLSSIDSRVIQSQAQLEDFHTLLINDLNDIRTKSSKLRETHGQLSQEKHKIRQMLQDVDLKLQSPVLDLIPSFDHDLNPKLNTLDDLIKLLETLFFQKKISLNLYLKQIRSLGYQKAQLLDLLKTQI